MAVDRVLALQPRGFCAGVEAAIASLAWLVLLDGPPVYCFHDVVHNDDVVARFEKLGVVFVADLDDVPPGAPLLLSAHGTSPRLVTAAAARTDNVVDAVCPMVAKVHREITRQAAQGHTVVYVGRPGHDESEAAMAIAPESTVLVEAPADLAALDGISPVSVLAQTTLRIDELEAIERQARTQFALVWTPPRADICYATTNRQSAVEQVAATCDAVVVVGSASSSNTRSLVDAARHAGSRRALRVAGPDELPSDLSGTVAVTAGASTPDDVVEFVIAQLAPREGTRTLVVQEETTRFPLPAALRARLDSDALADDLAALAQRGGAAVSELLDAAESRALSS